MRIVITLRKYWKIIGIKRRYGIRCRDFVRNINENLQVLQLISLLAKKIRYNIRTYVFQENNRRQPNTRSLTA